MKAARIDQYGGLDVIDCAEAPLPMPGDGEVLIRAQASSVNGFDCAVRAGYIAGYYQYNFPLILGLDVAGVVESVGSGVTQFSRGQAVYGRTDPAHNGANAEYVLTRAEHIALRPKSIGAIHAGAMPHVAISAWALVQAAELSAGQTVLIHGAAGGVGHIAVQLAKLRGARVIGTASKNIDFLDELGVDVVVNYATTPFESVAKNVDAVFDTIGGDTLDRSWTTLKPGGILLSLVQPPSAETAAAHGVRQQFVMAFGPTSEILAEVARLVDAGKLKLHVSEVLSLCEIQRGHMLFEGHHTCGKLALEISNGNGKH